MSTRPLAERPSRRNRDSADECCRSGPSSASGSRKTVTASSNETPCFSALALAFSGSHSNTNLVYTECADVLDGVAVHVVRIESYGRNFESFVVSELCHIPPDTLGQHRDLRRHAEADGCCAKSLIGNALVEFSVRQYARESISKRAPSTSRTCLRFKINRSPSGQLRRCGTPTRGAATGHT
jgi:hypothetical protein